MLTEFNQLNIQVEDITPYLHKTKWELEKKDDYILLYRAPISDDDGNPIYLVLPRKNSFNDSSRRIFEAIRLLSVIENHSIQEIIAKIKNRNKDIFLLKLNIPPGHDESLPLDKTVRILNNIKQLLGYAASTETNPVPYFNRSLSIGTEFVDNCRFGHTFQGSFGFSIESPIDLNPQISLPDTGVTTPVPFERRVIERTIRGLSYTQDAVLEGKPEQVAIQYNKGLNANMCETVVDILKDAGEISTEYSVIWSPEWPVSDDLKSISILLDHRASSYLESAARSMRSSIESQKVTIQGLITQLRIDLSGTDEDETDEEGDRYIVVKDKSRRNVHVYLDNDTYRSACDAHRDDKEIKITGILEKQGRFWQLMAPREVEYL